MSRWFRHYAGMSRDDKLVSAAVRSGQPVERVVWIWGAILESAAEINDAGRYELDSAEVAYFLRADAADVGAVLTALEAGGRICDGRVVKWSDRQFSSDNSAARQRRHRDRKRETDNRDSGDKLTSHSDGDDATITSPSRHCDTPDTDTETDTETEAAQPVSEVRAGAQSPPDEPEPSRKTELERIEAECREAAGLENDPSPSLFDTSPLNELLAKGYTLSGDILPRLRAAKAKGKRGKTWSYYVPIITEGKAANEAVPAKAETVPGKRTAWVLCDDRRWLSLAERYAKEHEGRRPPTTSGDGGMGWRFPPEWVDAADLEIPECLRRTA